MVCLNCGNTKTSVANSRPSKKESSIWRRRHCEACGITFTTREEPDIDHEINITGVAQATFSLAKLTVYLAQLLAFRGSQAPDEAFWLAKTIRISLNPQNTSRDDLIRVTHDVLSRFDPTAALQHAARYGLIENVAKPRRGRPRLKRK